MICILFVPGMFGSTIEAVLRMFTIELTDGSVSPAVQADGSMHGFSKLQHPTQLSELDNIIPGVPILTPIYPMHDAKLEVILEKLKSAGNTTVLIHAPDERAAELNMLFMYHKIAVGLGMWLNIFCANSTAVKNWNSSYTSWENMARWELREWLSLFYPKWITEWVEPRDMQLGSDVIKVANTDILCSLDDTVSTLILSLGLTKNDADIKSFTINWRRKQQYIINEFNLVDDIVNSILTSQNITWDQRDLTVISESIIQKRLRDHGFEIRCYGLDNFPTETKKLAALLDKQ